MDGHPARRDEHVDDDQRDRRVAARALHRRRRGAGRRPRSSCRARRRTTSSRSSSRAAPTPSRPAPSMRLIADMVAYTVEHVPEVEPDQHLLLPPAGGGRDAGAGDRLRDEQRDRGARRRRASGSPAERMAAVFGRISFFVNAGVRFIEEHAKLRAMSILWEELGRERYGVTDERQLRFRYGVQVNSLGSHRGAAGEQRAADRARGARRHARAQRPRPRHPAAGLERGARAAAPVGSAVVAAHPAGARLRDRRARVPRHLRGLQGDGRRSSRSCSTGARAEMAVVAEHGGAVEAVPYMKARAGRLPP